jgi:hypothetical protein
MTTAKPAASAMLFIYDGQKCVGGGHKAIRIITLGASGMSDGDSLKKPPNGGKVRQPWEWHGISRATYYRWRIRWRNQLTSKDPKDWDTFVFLAKRTQASVADIGDISIRTLQRLHFIQRYGIPEILELFIGSHCLQRGMLDEIARWEHEDQRRFVSRLIELGLGSDWKPEAERGWSHWRDRKSDIGDPRTGIAIYAMRERLGRPQVLRLAERVFLEVVVA